MKILGSILLLLPAVAFGQIPAMPGADAAQATIAFQQAQAQALMMTSQAQVQVAIAAQASMLSSLSAQAMFRAQAGVIQAGMHQQFTMANNQVTTAVLYGAMQQRALAQQAILRMRTLGIENQSSMVHAVQLASLDTGASQRQIAMVHAVAARASGQTAAQVPAATQQQQPTPDVLPVEAPPMMIRPTFGMALEVEKPKFSEPGGKVAAGTKVKIKSDTHYATLYYTTNGWTPTTQSAKYTGPITINATTHLQVMAMGPNYQRSKVERVDYEVENARVAAPETTVSVPADGTLRAGTPVRVAFGGKEISSETANVGDEITLLLDEDIKLGDTVLAAKGSRVSAALTIADAGHGAAPGDLVFEVRSVEVAGKRVPLFGGETLEGVKGGKDAVITPGMTAMAFVSADTVVK
jgi:hypothetical protein